MARSSAGGKVVSDSLAAVGLTSLDPRSSLIETTAQRRLDIVMVQNAWNVVDRPAFDKLLESYPRKWRARAIARRVVAQANIRRAHKVVCLTEAVARMVQLSAGVDPVVTSVAMPLHDWVEQGGEDAHHVSGALVVGSITWYKRPSLALQVVAQHFPTVNDVLFLGVDDGSGAWSHAKHLALSLGLQVEQKVVSHAEVYEYYRAAEVTILPSALESLGFGVVEALTHSCRVLTSDIPAHRDAARTLGGVSPEWIDSEGGIGDAFHFATTRPTRPEVAAQWRRVADEMTP